MLKYIAFATLLTLASASEEPIIAVQGPGCAIIQFDHPTQGTTRNAIQVPGNCRLKLPQVAEVYLYTYDEGGIIVMTGGSTTAFSRFTAENPLRLGGSCRALMDELGFEQDDGC